VAHNDWFPSTTFSPTDRAFATNPKKTQFAPNGVEQDLADRHASLTAQEKKQPGEKRFEMNYSIN
jgi:uncharacterized protein (DUF924 family)